MYLGIGFLVSGLIMLIWIWFETNRKNDSLLQSELFNIWNPHNFEPYKNVNLIKNTRHLQYIENPLKHAPRIPVINTDEVPQNVISAYSTRNANYKPQLKKTATKRAKQAISTDDIHRNQSERILNRFKLGWNDLEIAEELGIERDSVAFALNLCNYR
jgi:hypothetical protein